MYKRVSLYLFGIAVAFIWLAGCQAAPSLLSPQNTPLKVTPTPPLTSTRTSVSGTPPATAVLESHPPYLLDYAPRQGEEVSTTTQIELVFGQPMDRESVMHAIHFSPEIGYSYEWRADDTLILDPEMLEASTRYRLRLDSDAASKDGLLMGDPFLLAFSTLSPLAVTQISPEDGAVDLRSDTSVSVAFNRSVVPVNCVGKSAERGSACPELPLMFTPSLLGRGEWVNTSIYRFVPLTGWGAGKQYEATLGTGVRSVEGAPLRNSYTWSFEIAPPRVISTTPEAGTQGVLVGSDVRVEFNTPMNQEITGSEFAVVDSENRVVPGTITWQDNGAVLLFTPKGGFALNSNYTVRIGRRSRAVTSAPLVNPMAWSFQTVPVPQVTKVVPEDGTAGFGVNRPVQISFVGALDASTLSDGVRIEPAPPSPNLYAHFDPHSQVYSLMWEREPRTEYCVEVSSEVADIYGNAIEDDEAFCFETGDLAPRLELPFAGDAVTMDAGEPSILYMAARNMDSVSFALGEFDESAFVSRAPVSESRILREWTEGIDLPANRGEVVPFYLRRLQGALPTGFYGLEWEIAGFGPRSVRIAVVDQHVSIKMTDSEALIWVSDLSSGEPITRTAVRLVDSQGLLMAGGTTDDDGLARIPVSPVDNLWDQVAAVSGQPGAPGFGIAMTQWNGAASPWDFGLTVDGSTAPDYRGFLETDRTLYQPGQAVHFHGFIREDQGGIYQRPPDGARVNVILQGLADRPVYSDTLTLSGFGSFSDTVYLEESLAYGTYHLGVRMLERPSEEALTPRLLSTARIRVESYRKPAFEVTAIPNSADVRDGERIEFVIRAHRLSGGAIADADVDWVIHARPYGYGTVPDLASRMSRNWQWGLSDSWGDAQIVAQGKGMLDSEGKLKVRVSADLAAANRGFEALPQIWELSADVTDRSQYPVSVPVKAVGRVAIHQARFYLGLRMDSRMIRARDRVEIDVRAVDWSGDPVSNQTVQAVLAKRTWQKAGSQEAGWGYTDTLVSELEITTDALGQAEASFNPPRPGHYVVKVRSRDRNGDYAQSEDELWVSGDELVDWRFDSDAVTPILDRQTYEVGDTARIMVPTAFTGTYQLLLTVERDRLMHVERFTVDTPDPVIELPVEAHYVPNAYVSVLAYRPGDESRGLEVRSGYAELNVASDRQTLDLSIRPHAGLDWNDLKPGDEVGLVIRTADHQGEPVDAEVSLAVVDKALLNLQDVEAPSISEAFYGKRPLGVFSGYTSLVMVNRIARQMSEPTDFDDGPPGLGGGSHPEIGLSGVRQDFPDTAFWAPALRTGSDGVVEVSLELPDSLTAWVIRASAATADTRVGSVERAISVDKPLSIHPFVPDFLVVGDEANVVAVVHNRTENELKAQVSIEAEGLEVEGSSVRQIVVPSHGYTPVDWLLRASRTSLTSGALAFSVEAGAYRDAVRLGPSSEDGGVPIIRWVAPDIYGSSGVLREAGSQLETIYVPSDATSQSHIDLQLETSLAAGVMNQIRYLEPATSVRSSDAWANRLMIALSALQVMRARNNDTAEISEAHEIVMDALDHLYVKQNRDGGWGWRQEQSNLHLTSYVALALLKSEAAGFVIPSHVKASAMDYIDGTLTRALQADLRYPYFTLALQVLSLADRPWPSGAATTLYAGRADLGSVGRLHLVMALGATDASDPRIATLLEELRTDVVVSATGAHWESTNSQQWTTDGQVTGMAVEALNLLAPEDALLPQAVRWLMSTRHSGDWDTPYETAWAASGLSAYVQEHELGDDSFQWTVSFNGRPVLSRDSSPAANDGPKQIRFQLGEGLQRGVNVLNISREAGSGNLYYAANLQVVEPIDQLTAEERGFTLFRRYCRPGDLTNRAVVPSTDSTPPLGTDASSYPIWPPCEPLDTVSVGDRVEVRLSLIVPTTRHYVLLRDAYPAGFVPEAMSHSPSASRPIEEARKTSVSGGAVDPSGSVWTDPFEQREYHDRGAQFFVSELPPGTYEVRYVLRAQFPGLFHSLPATAHESYLPEVWGRTAPEVIEVKPAE